MVFGNKSFSIFEHKDGKIPFFFIWDHLYTTFSSSFFQYRRDEVCFSRSLVGILISWCIHVQIVKDRFLIDVFCTLIVLRIACGKVFHHDTAVDFKHFETAFIFNDINGHEFSVESGHARQGQFGQDFRFKNVCHNNRACPLLQIMLPGNFNNFISIRDTKFFLINHADAGIYDNNPIFRLNFSVR